MLILSVVIIYVLFVSTCYRYEENKGSHDEWRNTTVEIRTQRPSKKNEFPPPPYYLGINDHEVRGNFVSLASGRPAVLSWTRNEPDYNPGEESCVAIYNDSEKGMMTIPCSNENNFICQADGET